MSIVLITGSHPRHHYMVSSLLDTGLVTGWVKEIRESFVPAAPDNIPHDLQTLFTHHFENREEAEHRFFGAKQSISVKTLDVTAESLNDKETQSFVSSCNPSLVISYGCHKLEPSFLQTVQATFWNTHGGLSPDYRGVITHFWPSYFLEPQMTGMTLHETTDAIDGGGIIHQTAASMVAGDNLHALAARAVKEYVEDLQAKLTKIDFNNLPDGIHQKTSGRIFKSADWRPEHLRHIYETHNDRIVDAVISGELTGRIPRLVSAI